MADDDQGVGLANLAAGAVDEHFRYVFMRVIENCADPNTGLEAREIAQIVKVKPNKSRTVLELSIKHKTKLASSEALETTVYLSMTKLGLVASEYNPRQPDMFDEMETSTGATVTPLTAINGGNRA